MFTGIVEELGEVAALERLADGPDAAARLTVAGPAVTDGLRAGDSVAVNGVCLTVVEAAAGTFTADVMAESLRRTTLGRLAPGAAVNLERATPVSGRLGGHIVQGHVDATAELLGREHTAHWDVVRVGLPQPLARFVAEKGSVALDGVSLTVAEVAADGFTVGLIPETLARTTLGRLRPGDTVNVEVDVLAKYVERLLTARAEVRP
ncbi:MAG: riboflavin synthase [Actinomycetes bacterium]